MSDPNEEARKLLESAMHAMDHPTSSTVTCSGCVINAAKLSVLLCLPEMLAVVESVRENLPLVGVAQTTVRAELTARLAALDAARGKR